ncbi:MAG: hypothetical protein B7X07_01560 [Actinobacteria bacterium 21-64-8]|nr:MAG: hypothetical protein B7X07_01560 [Actinobacteria bacterium 21-64-8]
MSAACPTWAPRAHSTSVPTTYSRSCGLLVPEHLRVTFLGGLGEIGRNCLALEQDGRIVVVDAGLMFPEPNMYGVDLILPDFRWLIERRERVDAIVLTHGHEDHTGALRYLVKDVNVPIYGAPLTVGFARHRLTEAKVAKDLTFIEVADGERRRIGPFEVEFIPVTHSVPSAHALAFHTKLGVVVHSGDFKLDATPIDNRRTDLARLAALGRAPSRGGVFCQPRAPRSADHGRRRGARTKDRPDGALDGGQRQTRAQTPPLKGGSGRPY